MVLMPGCRCCSPCRCENGTRLPREITLSFSGLVNRTHTKHAALTFEAPFGSGAAGVLLAPGGCDDNEGDTCGASNRGPLESVLLTAGGSGYAVYGRAAPELEITATPGDGATFTAKLVENKVTPPTWSIESIKVEGGTGYVDGTPLTITVLACCPEITPATAVLATETERVEPTVTAVTDGGSPATPAVLSVSLTPSEGVPTTWSVGSVAVTSGGSGYDGDPATVVFSASSATTVTEAKATAYVGIDTTNAPTVTWDEGGGGFSANATFTVVTENGQFSPDGREFWIMSGLTITDGGAGYEIGMALCGTYTEPTEWTNFPPCIIVTDVDEDGAVTDFTIDDQGAYRKYTGAIDSVTVTEAGEYYDETDDGVPTSVTVTEGGEFYCIDKTAEPIVAEVTVTAGGGGEGAVITATVDDDVDSDTFGQIVTLAIDEPGDDYLAWHWICAGHAALNGKSFNVLAVDPLPLLSLSFASCYGCGAAASVTGTTETPGPIEGVTVTSGGGGYAVLGRELPSKLTIGTVPDSPGGGATFSATWEEGADECGLPYWSITKIEGSGGSGYLDGQRLHFPAKVSPPVFCLQTAAATIKVTGEAAAVASVELARGGRYYQENASLPALVADVEVTLRQSTGSSGSGAEFEAVIEDTPGDQNFGKITAVTVTDPGSGYTAFGGPRWCDYYTGCNNAITAFDVFARGGDEIEVVLSDTVTPLEGEEGQPVEIRFLGSVVGDCSKLPTSASLSYGAPSGSVTIAANGEETPGAKDSCGVCECPADNWEQTLHVEITSNYPCNDGTASYSGPLQDVDFGCSWTDPETDITYESDVTITFHCCPAKCDSEADACQYEVFARISGILGIPGDLQTWQSNGDPDGECAGVVITSGNPNATLTIELHGYTFTIVIGDG